MGSKKKIAALWGLAVFILVGLLTLPGLHEFRNKAVCAVAGKGMLSLVETSMDRKRVALTFDDGPSSRYTPLLLEGLKERDVSATFFLMGKNIEGNEELVKMIQEDGHLIGNHTYSHVQLNKIPVSEARQEIEKTSNEIYKITGVYPSYLRPPFGAWKKDMELMVTMVPVFWDIDTLDWKSKNVDSILKIVKNQVHDGAIILMHDEYQTSVDAALQLVDYLKTQNYEFVTVDKLLVL